MIEVRPLTQIDIVELKRKLKKTKVTKTIMIEGTVIQRKDDTVQTLNWTDNSKK